MKKINIILAGLISGLIVVACGGGSSPAPAATTPAAAVTSNTYIGAGSVWDVSINSDATFTIKHQLTAALPIDMTILGTYTRLTPTGYLLLTVTSSTGTSAAQPNPGDQAYALEVPGYAFLLAPISATDDQIVAMVSAGACPSTTADLNWVAVKSGLAPNIATNEFFGSASYTPAAGSGGASGNVGLGINYALTAGFPVANNAGAPMAGTCTAGVIHFPFQVTNGVAAGSATATGQPDNYFYVTAAGGGILHSDFSQVPAAAPTTGVDHIFFAVPVEVGTAVASLAGTYSGMVFDNTRATGNKTDFVKVTCDPLGQCIGTQINPTTDVSTPGSGVLISINAANSPSNGFFTGTIDGYNTTTLAVAGTPGNIACAIDTNANGGTKNVINCTGQSPNGIGTSMFNVLLTQR